MFNLLCGLCSSQTAAPIQVVENPHIPAYIQEIFERHRFNPQDLPVLDMNQFSGSRDYIQFIKPEHMTHPVMLFTDELRRPGIAFHIHGKASSTRRYTPFSLYGFIPNVSDLSGVFTVHRRYIPNPDNSEAIFVLGTNSILESVFLSRHDEKVVHDGFNACPTCPFVHPQKPIHPELLESLFLGTDPDFQLGENENFRLFAERVDVQDPSCLGWLYDKINSFFRSFMSCFSFCSRNPV